VAALLQEQIMMKCKWIWAGFTTIDVAGASPAQQGLNA
jgi:hypothetical protein